MINSKPVVGARASLKDNLLQARRRTKLPSEFDLASINLLTRSFDHVA